jgi:division protein CdvB (Snf7/Vps24/ESCRT-III family)
MLTGLRRVVGFRRRGLKERISAAILKIEEERHQLHLLKSRLEARRQALVDALEKAQESNDAVKITLYSDECNELRKVINAVSLCEVALTHIITRFESIRDINEAMNHMSTAATIIKRLYGEEDLTPALENIASEATKTLSEALADLSNLSCGFYFDPNGSVEGLTEDAERYALHLASEIDESLPSFLQQAKGDTIFQKMQTLTQLTESDKVGYDITKGKVNSKVEEKVRRFFAERGEYNIIEAAVTLNLPINIVEQIALKMISEESVPKLAPEVA